MFRYLPAALFIGASFWVRSYNAAHDDRSVLLPFMDVFVGSDIAAQERLTWQVCLVAGVALFAWEVFNHIRLIRRRRELLESQADDD